MTPDEATLMAYADGELDPIAAKRVERAIVEDPGLQTIVDGFRAVRTRVSAAYAPIAAGPVPDRLSAMLASNVVPLRVRPAARHDLWRSATAVAACLVVALVVTRPAAGPVTIADGRLVASGSLARSLGTELSAQGGETRILLSFRDKTGHSCRVFEAPALGGIACRAGDRWALPKTEAPTGAASTAYQQAGSADASLMAAAQDMMTGEAMTAEAERQARARGWR